MHPILSKASLREPDTERLNTMLRVALTPLQYETVVAVYLHGHPQKEVAIDRGVSPASSQYPDGSQEGHRRKRSWLQEIPTSLRSSE